jgi:hypothetical protein
MVDGMFIKEKKQLHKKQIKKKKKHLVSSNVVREKMDGRHSQEVIVLCIFGI